MSSQKKMTVLHRVLHWVMALAMSVLLITGFLRMYWMGRRYIAESIQSNTDALAKEQILAVAKAIREPMWKWHIIFANIMIVAFLVRIIYMIAKGIRFPNPLLSGQSLKERFQGFTYIYFYLFVFISAFTGVCLEQKFFPEWKGPIESIHKWGIYWFPIFIVLHIIGILIAEFTNKKGITSKMISGD